MRLHSEGSQVLYPLSSKGYPKQDIIKIIRFAFRNICIPQQHQRTNRGILIKELIELELPFRSQPFKQLYFL